MPFSDDVDTLDKVLERFPDKVMTDAADYIRERARVFHDLVILFTPYDTGKAKANWVVSIDEPDTGVYEPPGGRMTAAEAANQAKSSQVRLNAYRGPDQEILLNNNVPYIGLLEAGRSDQAPQGMVALAKAVVETQEVVNAGGEE